MATAAHNTNVVRLPTAASRQVKQPMNAAAKAARAQLRRAAPWPGEYIFPSERARRRVEAEWKASPEMLAEALDLLRLLRAARALGCEK